VSAEFYQDGHIAAKSDLRLLVYSELRRLRPASIGGKFLSQAEAACSVVNPAAEQPCLRLDSALLQAAMDQPDPHPLLCLRCRISHALEAWLRATHAKHGKKHGLDLMAMASYALDDEGELTIRTGPESEEPFVYAVLASLPKGLLSPFSAEILRTYQPSLCGLPHWSRLKIQSHNGLKAYFKQNGLLLISDWALLRHSSGKKVRAACERHLRSSFSADTCVALHARYQLSHDDALSTYKARTGKASGWQPDQSFAAALDPERNPFDTIDLLKRIATAIRQYMTGSTTQSLEQAAETGYEPVDPSTIATQVDDAPDPAELRGLIDAALQRAMDQHMPQVLANGGRKTDLLRCLWAGWAEGLTNAGLATRCRCDDYPKLSRGTVSKEMETTKHATTLAITAAVELKRHPAFASCGQSVEAAERLVLALRNHLLESEREGDVAPLRRWVQQYLSQP